MYNKMSGQMALVTIGSRTFWTFKLFATIPLMNLHMLNKILLMGELLITSLAGEHSDSTCMKSEVFLQVHL
jgi:hypothetical protein